MQKYHDEPPLISHEVESYIRSLLATHSSPGLAVSVVLKDPSVPTGFRYQLFGAGNARTSSIPPVPVTPDTLFAIASNSKLFLALSAGLLISNHSLDVDWTTKVATLIPEWGLTDPFASQEATILDLLVHRTGMPRHDFAGAPLQGGVPAMVEQTTLSFLFSVLQISLGSKSTSLTPLGTLQKYISVQQHDV
ncbi:hypothetical protein C0992_002345 [Termitomyces sp. T32_za158]|nr:hypothetical protein C0992_002345 [Termitomyces sp. T32_za158]